MGWSRFLRIGTGELFSAVSHYVGLTARLFWARAVIPLDDLHGYACLHCSPHTVPSTARFSERERQTDIRASIDHLLIAKQTGRLAIHLPVRRIDLFAYVEVESPLRGMGVSTGRAAAVDDH